MKRISIIGGGASGTLIAVNLMKNANGSGVEINLVERKSRIGRGVAFGTHFDTHLLNVPAGRMGAFPDEIGDFHVWLGENGHNYDSHDFVPRRLFGEYLRHVFTATAAAKNGNVRLNVIDDEAVDMAVNGSSAEVMLRSGEILPSHKVVLAFGNFKPPHPSVKDLSFTSSAKYFQDPWSRDLYESLKPDDSLLIIGTGLSMVDVALHLDKTGHRGKIDAISTRGLLPAAHELGHFYEAFDVELESMTRITDMMKCVRAHARAADASGSNWRAVIDSLRPATQRMWMGLPLAEKRYFMQHLSRYWNVARHRMPGEAAEVLDRMRVSGALEILKGRLASIEHGDDSFKTRYINNGREAEIASDILVNCIGSEANIERVDSEFVRNLVKWRHVRRDELSLGIKAMPDGRVFDKTDEYSDVVFTIGGTLKGLLWETTAIPEIRMQARALALNLLAN